MTPPPDTPRESPYPASLGERFGKMETEIALLRAAMDRIGKDVDEIKQEKLGRAVDANSRTIVDHERRLTKVETEQATLSASDAARRTGLTTLNKAWLAIVGAVGFAILIAGFILNLAGQ